MAKIFQQPMAIFFCICRQQFFAISTFTLTSNLRLLPNVSTRTSFYHNFESEKEKKVKKKVHSYSLGCRGKRMSFCQKTALHLPRQLARVSAVQYKLIQSCGLNFGKCAKNTKPKEVHVQEYLLWPLLLLYQKRHFSLHLFN